MTVGVFSVFFLIILVMRSKCEIGKSLGLILLSEG